MTDFTQTITGYCIAHNCGKPYERGDGSGRRLCQNCYKTARRSGDLAMYPPEWFYATSKEQLETWIRDYK